VPVTAKLSRKFYEAFGDDVAGELVDWMNATDTALRLELHESSEAQARALRAEWQRDLAALELRLGERMNAFEARMTKQFAEVDVRIEATVSKARDEIVRWIVAMWVATMVTFVGIVIGLVRALGA
jgi:ABC-type uncharacterized transport system auxiliary subunit